MSDTSQHAETVPESGNGVSEGGMTPAQYAAARDRGIGYSGFLFGANWAYDLYGPLTLKDINAAFEECCLAQLSEPLTRTKPEPLVQDTDETARSVENCPVVERLEKRITAIEFLAERAPHSRYTTGAYDLPLLKGALTAIHDLQVEAASQERWAGEYKAERDILQTTYEGCCKEYEKMEGVADALREACTNEAKANKELGAENSRLRGMLEWCARETWDGGDIDWGHFQDAMVERGFYVLVPADDDFKAEYESDEMYALSWSPLARQALTGDRSRFTNDEQDQK